MTLMDEVQTETVEPPVPPPVPGPVEEDSQRWFPTAFTVLATVLLVVWAASFVIPSGAYEVDAKTGGPKPGTYHAVHLDKSLPQQFYRLWAAPTNGLYGVQNEAGNVGVDNTGTLYGAAQIFLFVLAIGAFITVTMKTGAIQAGIGRLALRFQPQPIAADHRAHVRVRAGRDDGGHGGGVARILRPAGPVDARPRVRPHDRRRDHLSRGRRGRARVHRQPVRDGRGLGCRGYRRRRRHRPAGGDVHRPRRRRDRLRAPLCPSRSGRPVALGARRRRHDGRRPGAGHGHRQGRAPHAAPEGCAGALLLRLRGPDLRLRARGDIWQTVFAADFPLPTFTPSTSLRRR